MAVALCFSGETRSFRRCYPSIEECILSRLRDYTIFVYAPRDRDCEALLDLNPQTVVFDRQHVFDEKNYNDRLGEGQKTGVQGILRQLYGVWRCNGLKREYERLNNMRFRWVFRMRPDIAYRYDLENLRELDPASLYIPTHDNWYGLCDRFAFGGSDVMDTYANRIDHLDAYFQAGNSLHPEQFLKHHIEAHDIPVRRTRVVARILRRHGEEDKHHERVVRRRKYGDEHVEEPFR